MKVLFAGGGTLGSVNPLIAVYEESQLRDAKWEVLWVGTRRGPERRMVEAHGIPYEWIPEAKLPRYLTLKTIMLPVVFLVAFLRSLLIIMTIRPQVIVGAGSFVSVPIIWAGWILHRKIVIHQQDIKPTLSNKLTSWCAHRITVSFEKSIHDFPRSKTILLGNPIRKTLLNGSARAAREHFRIHDSLPVLLVVGGSTGAQKLNEWVWDHIVNLTAHASVIHITGQGKEDKKIRHNRYHQVPFLSEQFSDALALADVVVSRAGIGTIGELALLHKATVLIPMADTHQVDNAAYVASKHAAYFFREDQLDTNALEKVLQLIENDDVRHDLEAQMHSVMLSDGRQKMVDILESVVYESAKH